MSVTRYSIVNSHVFTTNMTTNLKKKLSHIIDVTVSMHCEHEASMPSSNVKFQNEKNLRASVIKRDKFSRAGFGIQSGKRNASLL